MLNTKQTNSKYGYSNFKGKNKQVDEIFNKVADEETLKWIAVEAQDKRYRKKEYCLRTYTIEGNSFFSH